MTPFYKRHTTIHCTDVETYEILLQPLLQLNKSKVQKNVAWLVRNFWASMGVFRSLFGRELFDEVAGYIWLKEY